MYTPCSVVSNLHCLVCMLYLTIIVMIEIYTACGHRSFRLHNLNDLSVGNLMLMICSKQGVSCHACFNFSRLNSW